MTFALILVTVVGQGLTLPWLIRRLGVVEDGSEEEREELRARMVIAGAALTRVDELGSLLYQRLMHEIYAAQRNALVALRNDRTISSEVMRRVARELDLEESRLEV